MTIRVLPDILINKIAAGEVVERPASVVKELVENAIDAGASSIQVELKGGGRSLIRVVDDGIGMNKTDALMSIERHATSKIRTAEDLAAVESLGFRGEALPSIAAVSKLEILTRPHADEVGTMLRMDGGTIVAVKAAGCAPGTEFNIRSLFFNLPVRRKFLRTKQTELAHCLEAVTREALSWPQVDFTVLHEDRVLLRAASTETVAQRVRDLLGEVGQSLVPMKIEQAGFTIEGLISPVNVHRASAAGSMFLYVNGRFVKDPFLRRCVYEAYRTLVPKGRYPVVVLGVGVDSERVDVNVHPCKFEVRFREPIDLKRVFVQGLRDTLHEHGIHQPLPRAASPLPHQAMAEPPIHRPLPSLLSSPPPAMRPMVQSTPLPSPTPAHTHSHAPKPVSSEQGRQLLPVERFRDLHVLGQFAKTYVLCEGKGELVVIDQHAAHERITLHELQKQRAERLGNPQRLLSPQVIELAPGQVQHLIDHQDLLDQLHLVVEPMHGSAIGVRAIPGLLKDVDLATLLSDLADDFAAGRSTATADEIIDHILATMACHNSVRAAQDLSDYQMRALLAALDEVDFSVCAHGRPVAITLSQAELEHRFHRT